MVVLVFHNVHLNKNVDKARKHERDLDWIRLDQIKQNLHAIGLRFSPMNFDVHVPVKDHFLKSTFQYLYHPLYIE